MVIKARKNSIYGSLEFEPTYINNEKILSLESGDGYAIIRLSDNLSYITDHNFDEVIKILNFG